MSTSTLSETFMNTGLTLMSDLPFKVSDLTKETVTFGRKEIELAEHEMPGLMAPEGRSHHRIAPHDHPDRCSHRDTRRSRR